MRRKSYRIISVINLIFLIFVVIVACAGCRGKEGEAGGESRSGKSAEQEADVSVKVEDQKEKKDKREEEEMPEVIYISPEEVYEILNSSQSSNYIILDVRTAGEFKEGYIEGAVNIPVSELESKLNELPKDKSIIIYCRSGSRSRSAADILVKNGFTHVYNMGGIVSWINSGYPVVNSE